jgi:hypothetical protein
MKSLLARQSAKLTDHPYKFYRDVLDGLNECRFSYLVGGGHALERYAGMVRDTKDLDLFVRPGDAPDVLKMLADMGYKTELCFPHWLGKVIDGKYFIDIIFSSGNGICTVDDGWFDHSVAGEILGVTINFCPPEELIWTKAFVMERERFDGADIAHIIRARGKQLDWQRLLRRFEDYCQVLLSHLILFDFIYPSERSLAIPSWVMGELIERLQAEKGEPLSRNRVCRGTLLSRSQYRIDVENWGYQDARQLPSGSMTAEQVANWTAAGEGSR